MRFRIDDRRWYANAPYRLHLPDAVIPVRCPVLPSSLTHGELHWTWCDDTEYRLLYPMYRRDTTPSWQIMAGRQTLAFGQLVNPSLRMAIFRAARPWIEWEVDGSVLVASAAGKCRAKLIQQRDRKRAALWGRRARCFEGVWRDSLDNGQAAVVFGMIMAWNHAD